MLCSAGIHRQKCTFVQKISLAGLIRSTAMIFGLAFIRFGCYGFRHVRLRPKLHSGSIHRIDNHGHRFVPADIASFTVQRRSYIATSELGMSIKDTPLGKKSQHLLAGLDVYTIPADGDSHPLTLYGINSTQPELSTDGELLNRRPLLLLHGRTWSSIPVYHLLGGGTSDEQKLQSRSTMEELLHAGGVQPYAMDFRGFGGTPSDESGWVVPNRCVADVETALKWIAERHQISHGGATISGDNQNCNLPALLGWSQGALIAQLVAQKSSYLMSKLILYGSIYDSTYRYPRDPLYAKSKKNTTFIENQYDWAIEDFTVEGSIPRSPAESFAKAALMSDPYKAQWHHLYEFNNLDPARVNIDTLVVAGDQDPYAPCRAQEELFVRLGRGAGRQWNVVSNADHALHLLDKRKQFIQIVKGFIRQ